MKYIATWIEEHSWEIEAASLEEAERKAAALNIPKDANTIKNITGMNVSER